MTQNTINYTKEMTDVILGEYQAEPSRETVDKLADKFNKSPKSIIGKLSREGVYERAVYKSKTGEMPITKVDLVSAIADLLEVEVDLLQGLDKAPKTTLKFLQDALI